MRITKEEALTMGCAGKKLHTVKKGQAWLFCPFIPGAGYHSVHWDHVAKLSVQCEGPGCQRCPQPVNRKVHIPCLLYKRPYAIGTVPEMRFPQNIAFNAESWRPKVIELTANCFMALEQPSAPDQLAVAWRPGDKQNGPLHFRWVEGKLGGVPDELAELDINSILPGVIGGTYRDRADVDLDKSSQGRIKHKI